MSSSRQVACPDPVCQQGQITVPATAELGDIFECPVCAAEVELVSLQPLEVELLDEEK